MLDSANSTYRQEQFKDHQSRLLLTRQYRTTMKQTNQKSSNVVIILIIQDFMTNLCYLLEVNSQSHSAYYEGERKQIWFRWKRLQMCSMQ